MIDWKATLMGIPGMRRVSTLRSKLSAQWFDWRYQVKTCGDEDPRKLAVVGENASHAIPYIPTTPGSGRHMLRDLPVTDLSGYTFIDMGSGKGRMLLLAAELPFRRIIGVEFLRTLMLLPGRMRRAIEIRGRLASRLNRSTWTRRSTNFHLNHCSSTFSIHLTGLLWSRSSKTLTDLSPSTRVM